MSEPQPPNSKIIGQTSSDVKPAGLIVREAAPENLEFQFHTLATFMTPVEQFFVRNHFAVPPLTAQNWQLRIEGAVERPLTLTLADLMQMPAQTQVATLECAGNSRAFLEPPAPGVPWTLGAVGNAEWTGVALATVLAQAGVKSSALEIILEGADQGEVKEEPRPPGQIHYVRSLTRAQLQQSPVLLAYVMNGEPLTPAHGFPVRALIPGWYGMAAVKWLTRIIVTEQPFQGYFQTVDYAYWAQRDGLPPQLVPITTMAVKAEIARPAAHEIVPANSTYRIHGAAWAGDAAITTVDISTDGGASWHVATLLGKPVDRAWRFWEFFWPTPATPGSYTVMARATDATGRTQPLTHDRHHGRYLISHVLPIPVEVVVQ